MDEWIHEIERAIQKYESTERTKKTAGRPKSLRTKTDKIQKTSTNRDALRIRISRLNRSRFASGV